MINPVVFIFKLDVFKVPEKSVFPTKFPLKTPVGPVEPVEPVLPVGPVTPIIPLNPVGPVRPVGPVGPVFPVGPVQAEIISNWFWIFPVNPLQ